MFPANLHPRIPPAEPGPITDDILETTIRIADQAQAADHLSEDGAALLLWIAAPALRELLQWRRRMAVIHDMASPGTVILFPGAR